MSGGWYVSSESLEYINTQISDAVPDAARASICRPGEDPAFFSNLLKNLGMASLPFHSQQQISIHEVS